MCVRRISTSSEARQFLVSRPELVAGWAAGMTGGAAAVATALLAAVSVRVAMWMSARVP